MVVGQYEELSVNEIWQEFYVSHNINDKFSAELLFNNLYSVNVGSYDWFLEGKYTYHWQSWLDVEGIYRHEYFKLGTEWVQEYRPMIRLQVQLNWGAGVFRTGTALS